MEIWKRVWQNGFLPELTTSHLEALRDGLMADDDKLLQGATTSPPPLAVMQDWPVEATCPLGWCGWRGDRLTTVGEVEQFFANLCFNADKRLGEPAACRWFLNWWDDTPRDVARRELLAEVELELKERSYVLVV